MRVVDAGHLADGAAVAPADERDAVVGAVGLEEDLLEEAVDEARELPREGAGVEELYKVVARLAAVGGSGARAAALRTLAADDLVGALAELDVAASPAATSPRVALAFDAAAGAYVGVAATASGEAHVVALGLRGRIALALDGYKVEHAACATGAAADAALARAGAFGVLG